jgi:hypothetical protein
VHFDTFWQQNTDSKNASFVNKNFECLTLPDEFKVNHGSRFLTGDGSAGAPTQAPHCLHCNRLARLADSRLHTAWRLHDVIPKQKASMNEWMNNCFDIATCGQAALAISRCSVQFEIGTLPPGGVEKGGDQYSEQPAKWRGTLFYVVLFSIGLSV